jgi:uncharacterized OB-fold protein
MTTHVEIEMIVRFPENGWTDTDGVVRLRGTHCATCDLRFFPAKPVCPQCGTEDAVEQVELAPRGRLYSFSVVHAAPAGFATPYVVGFVDLDDGVRVFSQIEGAAEDFVLDQPMTSVKGVIFTRADGSQLESFKFRPAHL